MPSRTFRDREEAGRELGRRLYWWKPTQPLVLALPCGGVPVGMAIASSLGAQFDVWGVHKITVPWIPELTVGAVAETGWVELAAETIRQIGLTDDGIGSVVDFRLRQLVDRVARLRGDRGAPDITGRTIILADDGVITGATLRAAIKSILVRRPSRLIVALPIASRRALESLTPYIDDAKALRVAPDYTTFGQWYDDFHKVQEREVELLLQRTPQIWL